MRLTESPQGRRTNYHQHQLEEEQINSRLQLRTIDSEKDFQSTQPFNQKTQQQRSFSPSEPKIRAPVWFKETNACALDISIPPPNKWWRRGKTDTERGKVLTRGQDRNVRSKIRWFTEFCNSHFISRFAAFFIVACTERSTANSCI